MIRLQRRMSLETIMDLRAANRPFLLDGGLGSELVMRGFDIATPLWSAEMLLSASRRLGRRGPRPGDFRDSVSSTPLPTVLTIFAIKPVPDSGRRPHIHVKVWLDGAERLTTQFFLSDHPGNE